MYLASTLNNLTTKAAVEDQLDTLLLLHPEDVPLTDKYGIRISADEYSLPDVANMEIPSRISNLGISALKVNGVQCNGRHIKVNLSYNNEEMTKELDIQITS